MIQRQDGWMFLSHSSKDFELVRQIRNTLEEHGFRPITFFLKCITDSTELDELIKREIKARRWFVFVDSENSKESKWAQEELAYARALNKKVYTIDTRRDYLEQLFPIMKRTTVFMSYSIRDNRIAELIRSELSRNDFQIWWDENVYFTDQWPEEMENQIDTAGLCMLLLSKNAVNSHHVRKESYYAFRKKRPMLVVQIGKVHLSPGLALYLNQYQRVRISENPTASELQSLMDCIIRFQERNDL